MSNIVRCKVTIRGLRPLLQHKFGPDALPLEKAEKTGVAGNDPEEWKRTRMVAADGHLYVNGTYFFSMLREAAKHTKKGKGSIQSLVAATLQVEEDKVVFPNRLLPEQITTDSSCPVYIDVCGVRNPSTKARNVRYRLAASPGWECTFHVLFDKTIVSRAQMQAVVNDAGTLVGLADGRSVGYGRFEVVEFEEQGAQAQTAA
jgi:hypothetical protein